jgi:hypothetical protein
MVGEPVIAMREKRSSRAGILTHECLVAEAIARSTSLSRSKRSSRRIVGGHLDGLRCWDEPSSRFLL